MKRFAGLVLVSVLIMATGLTAAGCVVSAKTGETTAVEVPYKDMVEDFIKNDATFLFDGIDGTLNFVNATGSTEENQQEIREWEYTVTFQTRHPGEGDRTGDILAQVITMHTAVVRVRDGQIVSAVCDKTWNMLTDSTAPMTVAGIIVGGGDTTPQGLSGVPRIFVYQVERTDGTIVNVSYTAYPPSPVGDVARGKIVLDFYGGTVSAGDRIDAMGTYKAADNTVVVAQDGDFIRTEPE